MSQQLINLSPDLRQLRDEDYDIEIRDNYLLIKQVPYVNAGREIQKGTLISELTLAGDRTTTPSTHVVHFAGEYPCNRDGSAIEQIRHQSVDTPLAHNLVAHHSFSSKPSSGYKNFHEKMTTYAAIISSPAQAIDSSVSATSFSVVEPTEAEESVFHYIDTASTRAGINWVTKKLELGRIAIVGVGGTGSYILDLVAKTPVKEIHLFDGDEFSQHNAFRSPGAPSIEELRERPKKVVYLKNQYSKMHRHIFTYDHFIDASNVEKLSGMEFVFLCLDKGAAKKPIVEKLEQLSIPFIDVGMGVELVDNTLHGIVRVSTSTAEKRDHIRNRNRISFSDEGGNNDYSQNIQIADLNALNAALAVIKWKKLFGFYGDFDQEYYSAYTIDGNALLNEDQLET